MEELSAEVRGTRILVVDGTGSTRSLLCSIIKCFGISRVFSAENAAEAMVILKAQPIDLVFSDWRIQLNDGSDFYRQLSLNTQFREIPLVLVAGEEETSQVESAEMKVLAKPFKARKVYSLITNSLLGAIQAQ